MEQPTEETVLGRITSVFGVKGWVRIYSYTDPIGNILDYGQWHLVRDGERQTVELQSGKAHGKGLIAKIKGYDTPEEVRALCGSEIRLGVDQLPELPEGEYYWHQLEGLTVVTADGQRLGKVSHLMETGSNDVMVVVPDRESLDGRKRLVPYLPGEYVNKVDLAAGRIEVDWDPEF